MNNKNTIKRLQRENFKDRNHFNKLKREELKRLELMIKLIKYNRWIKGIIKK